MKFLQKVNSIYYSIESTNLQNFSAWISSDFFNENLKEKLKNIDKCKYIDITDELMDKMTNTCKKEFVANMDHHLIRRKTGDVWFEKHLKNLF